MKSERRIARLTEAIRHTQPDLTLVLENIHDPHNVSAILRSCDAVGVRKISLLYTTESFPKVGKKSSASAYKWVERLQFRSTEECFGKLRDDGFLIAASVVDDKSTSLYDLDLGRKTALVFGNEHRGVSDEASAGADIHFQIPMHGMVQSLNVSVACAITLFEALRQRLEAGEGKQSGLSEADRRKLFDEWVKK